jgi:hypothetical protein
MIAWKPHRLLKFTTHHEYMVEEWMAWMDEGWMRKGGDEK